MIEDIKTKLNDVREIAKEQRSLLWRIENLSDKIDTVRDVGSRVFGSDKVQSNRIGDPTADKAIRVTDTYAEEFFDLCLRLEELKEQIDELKSRLDEVKAMRVLSQNEFDTINLFYFEGLSLDEVSEAMNYSLDWIQEMKRKAVRKWQKHIRTPY